MKKKADFLLLVATLTGLGLIAPWQSVAQSLTRSSGLYVQEIQLAQGRNQRTLSLHFSRPPGSVHAFALLSPARLVIDVRGEVERLASTTYTAADALITRVRAGSHPHYTRFVLDLKANQIPPFSVEQQAHVVTATLNKPDKPYAPNDNAEQADSPQQGNTQVLFTRTPETNSQRVLPRPAQAPASPAPTVFAKKVAKNVPPPPLRRATPPVPAPRVTPDREVPAQPPPLPPSSQRLRAAVPLKDTPPAVPKLPAPDPVISSQDTPQPPPVSSTASQHLRQGYALYNQGNLDGAIRQWREAIHQAPSYAEAHYRVGVALQERGELAQAITAFREAARLNPDDATTHIHLARACEAEGNSQDALTAYRKALQLVPTSAHVHHRVGHLLAAEGDLTGAMHAWRQTIHLQPDYAYAYVSLGQALGKTGQTGEAVAAYEQALRLDPRAPFVAEVRQQIARLRAAEP